MVSPPSKTKRFRQALIVKEVGAKPLRTPRGTVFKLGGGIFSQRQIIASRKRWARVTVPKVYKKIKGRF